MLTPQEVSEHAFAKASFGGYNMGMVDEFLDTLTEDYTALYKENTALKAKMKVLVDKVEEYRSTEEAMRKTLLTAQTMADEMIKEAKRKQAAMISEAENQAAARLEVLRQEIAGEEARLAGAKNSTTSYLSKVQEMHRRELEYLASLESAAVTIPEPPAADPVISAVAEIEANMNRMMEEAEEETEEELEADSGQDEADEEDTLSFVPAGADPQPTRRIDLDNLQFGKDFDL